jgi:hypothetical protein
VIHSTIAIIAIVVAAGLIIATFIVLTVRTSRSPLGRVLSLYQEAKRDEALARRFGYRGRVRPFRTEVWLRHKRDVDFLPEGLRATMNATYEDLARLNEDIGASIERHQESHLNTVNTGPVQARLNDIRQQLDDWAKRNMNNPAYAPKRPKFLWW